MQTVHTFLCKQQVCRPVLQREAVLAVDTALCSGHVPRAPHAHTSSLSSRSPFVTWMTSSWLNRDACMACGEHGSLDPHLLDIGLTTALRYLPARQRGQAAVQHGQVKPLNDDDATATHGSISVACTPFVVNRIRCELPASGSQWAYMTCFDCFVLQLPPLPKKVHVMGRGVVLMTPFTSLR